MRRRLFSDNLSNNEGRRKLFSSSSTKVISRRKLFSKDDCDCNTPPKTSEDKIVKCTDCGQTYLYDGSSLNLICSECGGDRFEFIENITDPSQIAPGDLNPIDRAFSEKRRKLFNDKPMPSNPSGSLTSMNPGPEKPKSMYECPDCGAKFMAEYGEQYVDYVNCPVCGGNRCRSCKECNEEELAFSDVENDELDEILTKYKGKSVNEDDLEAELHARGIYEEVGGVSGLVDKGYATENGDGQVMFSDIADFQRKMFSKLVISVTKEFDIPPVNNREMAIESLAEKFPGKSIMILKKAGSTVMPTVSTFSDKSYLRDSGIDSDLKVEYGGQNLSLKDFMNILNEEYPDAPDDIIDLLESSNTIKVNGGKVLISK